MTFLHADHVGSLLRPIDLASARTAHDAGALGRNALRAAEDRAIRDAAAMQARIGLKSITDGEFRRVSYLVDVARKLGGVEATPNAAEEWSYTGPDGGTVKGTRMRVSGPVRRPPGGLVVEDFAYLAGLRIPDARPKATLPAPTQIHWFSGRAYIDVEAYPDLDAFWADLAAAWRAEIQSLAGAGATFVQLDETCLPKLVDPRIQAILAARGDDWEALIDRYADLLAAVTADPPAGLTLAMHHCRGNNAGGWQAEGSYERVADAMFNRTGVQVYLLEYDTPRAGDFQPLRFLPKDKRVVLGLISTKTPELECVDDLLRRIEAAAEHVDIDRLGLSPQCGFSSTLKGAPLSHDDQARKLELVLETARRAWG